MAALSANLREHAEIRLILSALCCLPEPEDFLSAELVPRLRRAVQSLGVPDTVAIEALQSELKSRSREDLQVAYTRQFIGPASVPSPPYGSVYLEPGRHIYGDTTRQVERLYEEEGLVISEQQCELPDHLAVELEFSGHLLERACGTLDGGDTAEGERLILRQCHFEDSYLFPWLGAFTSSIHESTRDKYLLALAGCLGVLPECRANSPENRRK